jgi:hypothetical protein
MKRRTEALYRKPGPYEWNGIVILTQYLPLAAKIDRIQIASRQFVIIAV